jgi:tripartite ATP-independent transporter DctP family solute receptor
MKLRWGNAAPLGAPLDEGARRFAKRMEEETKGAIHIDVYAQSQLGNERDLIEGISMGTVDFCHVTGALTNFSPAFLTFDLPYIMFNTPEGKKKAFAVLDGPVGREVLDTLLSKGIKGLCFWDGGFRNFLNSKRAVKVPGDIKDLKIRTMENETHLAFYKTVGAQPVAMSGTEAFTALQQGVIDGMDNILSSFYLQKAYEVAPFVTLSNHMYSPAAILTNLNFYNSLSDDHRKTLDTLIIEVQGWERDLCAKIDIDSIEGMKKEGATIVEVDYDVWAKASQEVHQLYKDKINQKHLDAFLK